MFAIEGRRRRVAKVLLLAGIAALLLPGCAGWRGARLYASGTAALERGDVDRAVADLESAARLAPASAEVQNHLGIAYAAADRPADAARAFERAVALDCTNDAARENLARARRRAAEAAGAPPAAREAEGEVCDGG